MEAALVRIPAFSRRQAMDWSLVLISQGIESIIDYSREGEGWGLLVGEMDKENALEAIRLYRIENRRWPWRREMLQSGLLFDWTCLFWVLLVGMFFFISEARPEFPSAGVMDSVAVSHGQWWRMFTAVWLHGDVAHLAGNASLGAVLLGFAMGRYGTGAGLLAAYLAGVLGNVTVWLLSWQPHHSLGASGMVMGCLGLLAIQSIWLWRRTPFAGRSAVAGVIGGLLLFVLLGLAPETDTLAHAGGFVGGMCLGAGLSINPNLLLRAPVNLSSGFLFAALVLAPWWLALKHVR